MIKHCKWCGEELFLDLLDKRSYDDRFNQFCSRICWREYKKRERIPVLKQIKCPCCKAALGDQSYDYFCSPACQRKSEDNPYVYCKIHTAHNSKLKTPHGERRRLYEAALGRKLTFNEALILTCEELQCINTYHVKRVSAKEAEAWRSNLHYRKLKEQGYKG